MRHPILTFTLSSLCALAPLTAPAAERAQATYASPYLVDDPDAGAQRGRRLAPREAVLIIDRDGRWVRVRTREGETGWVRASQLRTD